MRTGAEILEAYQKQRDFSGSEFDSYAQDLYGFYFHAQMQSQVEMFFQLLENAELENKRIVFAEPEEDILYDDYPVEELILVDK